MANVHLRQLFESPDDAQVDIIFVPGLSETTNIAWAGHDDNPLWPEKFLQTDIPATRILAYDYNRDINSAHYDRHAKHLCEQLMELRRGTPSIIKSVANTANSSVQTISKLIRGLAFFGTPFRDTDDQTLEKRIAVIQGLFKNVKLDTAASSELLSSLPELLAARTGDLRLAGVAAFHEGRKTRLVDCSYVTLVDGSSVAVPDFSVVPLCNDHLDIGKFESQTASYKQVVKELQRLAQVQDNRREATNDGARVNNGGAWCEGNKVFAA
ncbi:hypothetical protein F5Y01DRAFT_320590 [Xylaria sp. FL0043]|nr:hypothetical protein F5Y01DRAFT_320590 [Xylaria sp. FL0043]